MIAPMHIFPPLVAYKFRFLLDLGERRHTLPPYLGSTIRGLLAAAFRRTVCVTHAHVCNGCVLLHRCAYPYLFETPPPPHVPAPLQKRFHQAPRPYVLDIPAAYGGEMRMEFGITLVGRAVNFLPHLIFVVDEIGNHGIGHPAVPYRLRTVADGSTGDSPVIFRAGEKALTENFSAIRLQDLSHADDTHVNHLSMEFLTPLRVKKFGDYQETGERMTFATLIDLLIGRLATLAYFHCEHEWTPLDGWQEAASRIDVISNHLRLQRLERYSNRHRKKLPLHGLVGTIGFEGELANFLPLLRMGEYTHIGPGTAFGLGRYQLHAEKRSVSSSGSLDAC